jgi:hypothetical protein
MKAVFTILACFLFAISCKRGSFTPVSSYKIVLENDEIGEYLQALSSEQALTFVRKSPNPESTGLALINFRTDQIRIVDPQAADGRDLLVSGSWAAYRIQSSLHLLSLDSMSSMTLALPSSLNSVIKVRSFLSSPRGLFVGLDNSAGQSFLVRYSQEGEYVSHEVLPGSPRFHERLRDGRELILIREPTKTAIYEGSSEQWELFSTLQSNLSAQYAAMVELKERVGIAFFDDQTGVLKWAEVSSNGGEAMVKVIDGVAGKTYRGLDIDIALFDGEPILTYLDGWSLKFHVARRLKDGDWRAQEVPIQGAVGFYSQILSVNQDSAQIAFHNFRTDHPETRKQTYEDLVWIETLLP